MKIIDLYWKRLESIDKEKDIIYRLEWIWLEQDVTIQTNYCGNVYYLIYLFSFAITHRLYLHYYYFFSKILTSKKSHPKKFLNYFSFQPSISSFNFYLFLTIYISFLSFTFLFYISILISWLINHSHQLFYSLFFYIAILILVVLSTSIYLLYFYISIYSCQFFANR